MTGPVAFNNLPQHSGISGEGDVPRDFQTEATEKAAVMVGEWNRFYRAYIAAICQETGLGLSDALAFCLLVSTQRQEWMISENSKLSQVFLAAQIARARGEG